MRNPKAPHVDFHQFKGLLPNPKAVPSNIDMILERRGHFLVGEWKRQEETISQGQLILLKALARIPQMTVIVVNYEVSENKNIIHEYGRVTEEEIRQIGYGFEELASFYSHWWDIAERRR